MDGPARSRLDRPPPQIAWPDPAASANTLQRDLLEKLRLEAAMIAAPADRMARAAYFDLLAGFAAGRTGLSHALLPEIGHPLYFRCGSSDVANLAQIFRDGGYGFPMRATPRRILDLGAYAGYAAVGLARRFPQAQILCVEPQDSSFRLLTLNTACYGRIRRVNAAVWHGRATLAVAARYDGDWGTQLQDGHAGEEAGIPALGVADLLDDAGWDQADLIKCDIEGAERAVFADPRAAWLRHVDVLAIELHDAIMPGSTDAVGACFPDSQFALSTHGETHLYQRRQPFRALAHPAPREARLLHGEPGLFPFVLQNVAAAPWAFFTYDATSCQLHPNEHGRPAARAIFPRTLDGQTRFSATLHHAGPAGAPVCFSVSIEREDTTIVAAKALVVPQGGRARLNLTFPALEGRHRIALQTDIGPHDSIDHAWARWVDPMLS